MMCQNQQSLIGLVKFYLDLNSRDGFQDAVQVVGVAHWAGLQPRRHVGIRDWEPLALRRQRVVVERGRHGRVDVVAQRHELVVGEELPEHGSPGVGRPADEPVRVVQAVAVHAEPRVVHADLAHQLDRQS